jgi:uncharacterized OB-fold protein
MHIAYVDLDDGPRVLFHVDPAAPDAGPPAPGTRVEIAGRNDQNDPMVRCIA